MFRKILITLLAMVSLSFALSKPASAEVTGDQKAYAEAAGEDNNLVELVGASTIGQGAVINCMMINFGDACQDSDGNPIIGSSAFSEMSLAFNYMYDNRTANFGTYAYDIMHNNLGIVSDAYAQDNSDTRGIGFVGLQPVLQIWKAFRNITYFFFAIFMVVLGFMIMLRSKINPQTIVTIQSALPQVILTLLLITFSYAIAGFVVDILFFSIFLVAGVFETANLLVDGQGAANELLSRDIVSIGFRYFLGWNEASGIIGNGIGRLVDEVLNGGIFIFDGKVIALISNVLTRLIATVAIIIAVFRTFFALLKAYISLIFNVVTAPFQILMNVIPGSNAFVSWFKKIMADASAFVIVAVMILLGIVIMGYSPTAGFLQSGPTYISVPDGVGFSRSGGEAAGFAPPFILPGNSEGTANILQAIIGFGIIMLLPEAANMGRQIFGVGEDKLGGIAMQNFMRGSTPVTAPARYVGGIFTGGLSYAAGLGMQLGALGVANKAADAFRGNRLGSYMDRFVKHGDTSDTYGRKTREATARREQARAERNRRLKYKRNIAKSRDALSREAAATQAEQRARSAEAAAKAAQASAERANRVEDLNQSSGATTGDAPDLH